MLVTTISTTSPLPHSTILVVDDEPVNVRLLEKMLAREQVARVVSTTDPREVLGLCRAQPFDLILLDINMPHMDGYAVMEALRQEYGQDMPPILVLTAQHSDEFRLRALEKGARDFLTKPFDRVELLMRVSNLLEVHLYHKSIRDQRAVLEQMVAERTQELHDTRLEIVRRLGRAAEYRDNETGLHIIRMSKYSAALGAACGLDAAACDLLLNASPMHDIGKIGIADQILRKPGRLTEEEFDEMKRHTLIGADLLSGNDSEILRTAREIALTHHEKWDGTGYPHGLAGEDIPLNGRIVAIADVFDALTSVRPYKKAWSLDDAFALISENAGTQFDPALAALFLNIRPQIEAIHAAHVEPPPPAE